MTDEIARHYQERHVHARRFVTIYDGIEPSRFVTGGGAAVRREFGIPDDAPVVGIVGHVQEWKGQLARRRGRRAGAAHDPGAPLPRSSAASIKLRRGVRRSAEDAHRPAPTSRATSC